MISVSFGTFERESRGRADLGHCWTVCAAALLCVKIAFSANGLDQVWNYFVTFGRHCIFFCCRIRWPRAGEACQRYCVRASISRTDTLKNISQRCHYYIVSIFNSDSLTPRATRTFRTHTTNLQANFFVLFFFLFCFFARFCHWRGRRCVAQLTSSIDQCERDVSIWGEIEHSFVRKKFSMSEKRTETVDGDTSFPVLLLLPSSVCRPIHLPSCVETMCRFSYEWHFMTKLIRLNRHMNTFYSNWHCTRRTGASSAAQR